MDAAVSSSLLQQQELYSTIQHMTGQFMQQKSSDLATMQVSSRLIGNACTCIACNLVFSLQLYMLLAVCWLVLLRQSAAPMQCCLSLAQQQSRQ